MTYEYKKLKQLILKIRLKKRLTCTTHVTDALRYTPSDRLGIAYEERERDRIKALHELQNNIQDLDTDSLVCIDNLVILLKNKGE